MHGTFIWQQTAKLKYSQSCTDQTTSSNRIIYNLKTHLKVFFDILQEWAFSLNKCHRKIHFTLLNTVFGMMYCSEFFHRWHTDSSMLFRLKTGRGVVWHTEQMKVIHSEIINNNNKLSTFCRFINSHIISAKSVIPQLLLPLPLPGAWIWL